MDISIDVVKSSSPAPERSVRPADLHPNQWPCHSVVKDTTSELDFNFDDYVVLPRSPSPPSEEHQSESDQHESKHEGSENDIDPDLDTVMPLSSAQRMRGGSQSPPNGNLSAPHVSAHHDNYADLLMRSQSPTKLDPRLVADSSFKHGDVSNPPCTPLQDDIQHPFASTSSTLPGLTDDNTSFSNENSPESSRGPLPGDKTIVHAHVQGPYNTGDRFARPDGIPINESNQEHPRRTREPRKPNGYPCLYENCGKVFSLKRDLT